MEAKMCAGTVENMGKTVKLYENDSYVKAFEAVVLECLPKGESFEIVVDKTAFFPEGGGQNADTGVLGDASVIDVKERQGIIYHKTDKPLAVGTTVEGIIDWARRFDYMQQHSGEHIVSGIVHSRFGYDNVGFHLGDAVVTLDFNGELTQEALAAVESCANQAVFENGNITVSYPDEAALAQMDYRSKIEIEGQVRLVTVENYDVCACCAPHVARTGEIGLIKILSCQKYKGGVRISIACGRRALADYRMKQKNVGEVSVLLSAKPELVSAAVEKLYHDMQALKFQLGAAEEELIMTRVAQLNVKAASVCLFVPDTEAVVMRKAVNAMTAAHKGYCAVFAGNDTQGYKFLAGCAEGDARAVLNALKADFTCRGGGRKEMVQGQIKGAGKDIERAFMAYCEGKL